MMRYLPAFADRPVPRYTSYPTAAEFTNQVNGATQSEALKAVRSAAPVSLYVHIPYCRKLCFYCACNTGPAGKPERQARYLAALKREADLVADQMRGRLVSIHFGGGSPNALAPADFEDLALFLRTRFECAEQLEIAVELDPRLMNLAYAEALSRAGVTRASLGVQTFAPHVQEAIGRVQPFWQVFDTVRDLRRTGIDRISFDLMYGLPRQSVEDVATTIAEAMSMSPDRIAMFGYAHVPAIQPRQRPIDAALLPDGATRFAQSALAFDMLVVEGYQPIGFDHFARADDSLAIAAAEGRLKRNFQGFTDEPGVAVIGLGASAISQFDDVLIQNRKHEADYRKAIENGSLAGVRGVRRTTEDRLRGEAIMRFLCEGAIDLAQLAEGHDQSPETFVSALPRLTELEHAGLVTREGWSIRLTEAGRPYARVAASAFDAWRDGSVGTFSQAV